VAPHNRDGPQNLVSRETPNRSSLTTFILKKQKIHRTLNFLAVLIIVAAVVSAVLNKQRWTGPWFGRPQIGLGGWHSLVSLDN